VIILGCLSTVTFVVAEPTRPNATFEELSAPSDRVVKIADALTSLTVMETVQLGELMKVQHQTRPVRYVRLSTAFIACMEG
jgi:hypothetical protein